MRLSALIVCAGAMFPCLPLHGQQPRTLQEPSNSAHLIVIRFSEELFEPIIDKEVNVTNPVNEVILGTRVRGQSRTRGKVNVDIAPNTEDASLLFTFAGHTHARTVGRNGPAIVHSRATTDFHCSAKVTFDLEQGFRAGPPRIESRTVATPVDIKSVKGGLRGRLVRRIAWRRVAEQRSQVNAESTRLARRDIVAGFQKRLDKQLAELNQRVATTELVTALLGGITETEYSVSSTDKYIELCIRRKGTPEVPADIPEDHVADAAIEVWVHSSLMDPEVFDAFETVAVIRNTVQPLVSAIAASWRAAAPDMGIARRIGRWRLWDRRIFDRPVFDRRLLVRLTTQRWAASSNRRLVGPDIANDWLVFGFNDIAVGDRRARDLRSTQPVSNRN